MAFLLFVFFFYVFVFMSRGGNVSTKILVFCKDDQRIRHPKELSVPLVNTA